MFNETAENQRKIPACEKVDACERIHIGNNVHVTAAVIFLTHYLDTSWDGIHWKIWDIYMEGGAFIGSNTIITKPCRIGRNAIVGVGFVVTKDTPDNEIWVGNPARLIKKR